MSDLPSSPPRQSGRSACSLALRVRPANSPRELGFPPSRCLRALPGAPLKGPRGPARFPSGLRRRWTWTTPRGTVRPMPLCAWCRLELPATARQDSIFCGKRCRQAAFRLRRQGATLARTDRPLRLAYADPPYPGTARKYYGREPTYAGEVDHEALIASLRSFDGWALSTSARALRDILPLCPSSARVAAWVKPIGVSPATFGLHNTWEPLIVVGGRQRRPGVRDWLAAQPARSGGELPGRKPGAFCAFLFRCLGMCPGDELTDIFPGTGIVGRAWAELSRRSSATDASAAGVGDASPASRGDSSDDASPVDAVDASPLQAGDAS